MKNKTGIKRGDTLVEVVFAIAVFAFVAIMSITLMNSGIASAQAALEITMARNEIDAQAEGLRFIHNAFLSERNLSSGELILDEYRTGNKWYGELWRILTRSGNSAAFNSENGLAILPNQLSAFNIESCSTAYDPGNKDSLFRDKGFVLNTRLLSPNKTKTNGNYNVIISSLYDQALFQPTPLYPRIIFSRTPRTVTNDNSDELLEGEVINSGDDLNYDSTLYQYVARVEGIWVVSVRDANGLNLVGEASPDPSVLNSKPPEFYDFHIRTCWYAPGRDIPTTIATIVRLYNPEYVEASR